MCLVDIITFVFIKSCLLAFLPLLILVSQPEITFSYFFLTKQSSKYLLSPNLIIASFMSLSVMSPGRINCPFFWVSVASLYVSVLFHFHQRSIICEALWRYKEECDLISVLDVLQVWHIAWRLFDLPHQTENGIRHSPNHLSTVHATLKYLTNVARIRLNYTKKGLFFTLL